MLSAIPLTDTEIRKTLRHDVNRIANDGLRDESFRLRFQSLNKVSPLAWHSTKCLLNFYYRLAIPLVGIAVSHVRIYSHQQAPSWGLVADGSEKAVCSSCVRALL